MTKSNHPKKVPELNVKTYFYTCASEGLILLNYKGEILEANPAARSMLAIKRPGSGEKIDNYLRGETLKNLLDQGEKEIKIKNNFYFLSIKPLNRQDLQESHPRLFCLLVQDITRENKLKDEVNQVNHFNRLLQAVYKHFSDTIYIADGKGFTIRANETVAQNCGVAKEYFVGKNVMDLEKEGVFCPSVTAKVLASRQREIVIQKTRIGKTMVAVGIPVMDEDGNLIRVIAISRNITGQLEICSQLKETRNLEEKLEPATEKPDMIFCSRKMQNILELTKLVAEASSTVLILGESGVGKDVLAKKIHKLSGYKSGPFIKVSCGAIPENLIESELFGYTAGAFTGAKKEGRIGYLEAAQGGTVFLDEVSELPLSQQVKLLQVLQDKRMTRVGSTKNILLNVRFIAATNKDLQEMVAAGRFREDLYYRLNVVPIHIPPLRERKEEIPLFAHYFLDKFNNSYNRTKQFTEETLSLITNYYWPGNVRELENTIERLVVTTKHPFMEPEDLPQSILFSEASIAGKVAVKDVIPLKKAIAELEKQLISMALQQYGSGNKAADALEVDQSTLSRKIKKFKLY